jgi:hypothetical protein
LSDGNIKFNFGLSEYVDNRVRIIAIQVRKAFSVGESETAGVENPIVSIDAELDARRGASADGNRISHFPIQY